MFFFRCFTKLKVETYDDLMISKNILDRMSSIEIEEKKHFSFKDNTFYGYPTNIYDGNTFSFVFTYKNEIIKYRCKCKGYSVLFENKENNKVLMNNSKERFRELLEKHETKMIKVKCYKFDDFGQILVDVWNMVDIMSINDIMIKEKYGKVI